MRLSDVSITKRIFLAVSIPIALLATLSYQALDQRLGAYSAARGFVQASEFISSIGNTVHQLQIERGESAALLGGKGTVEAERHLVSTRSEFDRVASSAVARVPDGSAEGRHLVEGVVADLLQIRQRIDRHLVTPVESTHLLSELVSRLLQVPRDLAAQNGQTRCPSPS